MEINGTIDYEGYEFAWVARKVGDVIRIIDCDPVDENDEELQELLENGDIQTDDVAALVLRREFGDNVPSTEKTLTLSFTGKRIIRSLERFDSNYDNSTEVFTYEIGKYFDWLDNWDFTDDTLTFTYTGSTPDEENLRDRIATLAKWI